MPVYVLMTKLGQSGIGDLKQRRSLGQQWKKRVEAACPGIKWIAHFALLGPYDFMDVYEVPEAAMAFQVSSMSREEGAVTAESWPATAYEDYVKAVEKIAPAQNA